MRFSRLGFALLLVTAGGLAAGYGGSQYIGAPSDRTPVHHLTQAVKPAPTTPTTIPATTTTTAPLTTSTTQAPTTTTTPPTLAPGITVPASTTVAVLKGDAPGSAAPGGPVVQTVPGTWYGWVSSLPVINESPGWLDVRLAQRPNGSTAWIPAADATLKTTPDVIVVDLSTRHLGLYVSGKLTGDFPVGIGLPATPTPTGNFFVAFIEPPIDAGYGPFIMVTSAHSDAIANWAGSGDAIIGIHGPIDAEADAEIGTTGAQVSNGCIRLHVADQEQLANVPVGSPIDIVQ